MRALVTIQKCFVRKLKAVPREDWVVQPADAYVPFQNKTIDFDIKYFKDAKK